VSGEHAGDALSALVDGELDPEEEAVVRAHLAECQACTDELEDIRRSRRVVRLLPAVDLPRDVTARLFAIGDPASAPSVVSVLGHRRRLATAVAVAASVAALALVGGPADPDPQPVTASLTGAFAEHVEGQAALFVPTAAPMPVDRLRAPYRAPVRLDGGYRLVHAIQHADGLQLLYQHEPYVLSVFELEGTLDTGALPADGHWVRDGGEAAWQLEDAQGSTLVILDRTGVTVTVVGAAPAEDVLRVARSFPDPRGLPMATRLRRACADALRSLSPL
jgi:hypothetical protein